MMVSGGMVAALSLAVAMMIGPANGLGGLAALFFAGVGLMSGGGMVRMCRLADDRDGGGEGPWLFP
jgi:hypothetical protein